MTATAVTTAPRRETVRIGQNIFVRACEVRGGQVTLAPEGRDDGEPVVLRRGGLGVDEVSVASPRPRVKRPA